MSRKLSRLSGRRTAPWLVVVALLAAPAAAPAQSLDDVLGGFEDKPAAVEPDRTGDGPATIFPEWLEVGGSLGLFASHNYSEEPPNSGEVDYGGPSSLRARADLEADLKLPHDWLIHATGHGYYDAIYLLRGRHRYARETLDSEEVEFELGEAWVRGGLGRDLDIKVGRQVVVWGKSDSIRVTDVLNPIDIRRLGLTDIADLRIPQAMTRVDYYFGDWNLSGIVIHEVRQVRAPARGSDFGTYAYPDLEEHPPLALAGQEYGLALNGVFAGWDMSFYGAYLFDDSSHRETTPNGIRRKHAKISMGGLAGDVALGNWLLKGEAAYLRGLEFFGLPGRQRDRVDVMLGAEYSGFTDTSISLEAVNRHLRNYDQRIRGAPDDGRANDFQSALRLTRTFLNQTLELSLLAVTSHLTGDNGGFQRLQINYHWTDDVEVTAGLVNYFSGDKLAYRTLGHNDRLFIEVKVHF